MAMQSSRVVQVLELLLQNPDTILEAATICSLLCSSKAIRAAAQQAGGPCTSIFLAGDISHWDIVSRVASLAKWLPTHANLVGALALQLEPNDTDEFDGETHNVLDTILGFSAQKIAASASGSSTGSAAAPASQQQQQQQGQPPPFALRSFSSSIRHSATVLSALPAATLTNLFLNIDVSGGGERRPEVLVNALARLTNLRCLDLRDRLVGSCLAVIGQLTQLTSLYIDELDAHLDEMQHLPASLMELRLPDFYVCRESEREDASVEDDDDDAEEDSEDASQFDLSHLTRLTNLLLDLDMSSIHGELRPLRVSGLLPLQLLQLDVGCHRCAVLPMLNVTALQQLQHLTLTGCVESEEGLLALSRLTAMTNLELGYRGMLSEVDHNSTWAQLSQLRSLQLSSLSFEDQQDDEGPQFRRVMQGVAAATSLRQLRLDFSNGVATYGMRPKLFGYLTGLLQLKELQVITRHSTHYNAEADTDDVMHLTALTGLTNLDISAWRVGDVAAVALACHLSALRELRLVDCRIESKAALPAIGKLVRLQHLDLSDNALGSNDCLKLLTQLRALTSMQLVSIGGGEPSKQEWEDFWAAVRGQREQQQ